MSQMANTGITQLPTSLKPVVNPTSLVENKAHSLQQAFTVFNDISLQLADSYQHLESKVAQLTDELEVVTQQRFEELKQKEQLASRLETLLSVLPGGVIVLDCRGVIIESNPTAESMLGQSLVNQSWRNVIKRCFAPQSDDGHEVSTHTGKRFSIATRSLDNEGQIILLTDQTETRQLQAKLSRHERLSALGKMVSALAHQVRTPLSSAILYANHLKEKDLAPETREKFSTKLLNQLDHLEQQVKDMLLFVKGEVSTNDVVSAQQLVSLLKEASEVPLANYGLSFHYRLPKNCEHLAIRCNKDALVSALLNLYNNSLQAIGKEGRIELSIKAISADKIAITICDNGKGIKVCDQDNAREIFFTTKSQGTGIGLSVVAIVAKAHGGRFSLRSREQVGTVASLILPLHHSKELS